MTAATDTSGMGVPPSEIVRRRSRSAPAGVCRRVLAIGLTLVPSLGPVLAAAEQPPRLVPIAAPAAATAVPASVGLPRLVPITREQLAEAARWAAAPADQIAPRPAGLVPIAFAPTIAAPVLQAPALPPAARAVQHSLRSLPVEPPAAPRPTSPATTILPPLATAPVLPSVPAPPPPPLPPPAAPVILPPLPSVAAHTLPPIAAPRVPALPPPLPVATPPAPVATTAAVPPPLPALPVAPQPAPPPAVPPPAVSAADASTVARSAPPPVVPPATPSPVTPPAAAAAVSGKPADAITIGSFNIQVFGESKISKPHVVDVLAKVVRGFDVVAIQEVRAKSDSVIPQFVSAINADGSRYAFVIGPRLGRTASKEQYTFIYDTTRIEVDPSSVGTSPNPGDRLHRPPLHARFRTRANPPEAGFSFWLVDTHTDPDEVKQEVDALAQVFMEMKALRPDEDDVILLGDLNAGPPQFGRIRQIPGIGWAVSGVPTNTRRNKTYDNIIFDQAATTEYTGRWGVLDLQNTFGLSLDKALEVSDHNPVWATFRPWESRQLAAADAAAAVR